MKATGWKVACSAVILAIGLLTPTAFLYRGPLLKSWYGFRIRIAAESQRWDTAKWIEDCGIPGREAAEEWYLSMLKTAAGQSASKVRDRTAAVITRGPIVATRIGQVQFVSFSYRDEEDGSRAGARLGALRSLRAIPFLVQALSTSRPELPLTDALDFRAGAQPAKVPLECLHFTTAALHEIGPSTLLPLTEALRHEDENVRLQAALAIRWFCWTGPPLEPSIRQPVIEHLKDPNRHIRRIAAEILGKGEELQAGVPILVEALHADAEISRDSAVVLARLGVQRPEERDALERSLLDGTLSSEVRIRLLRQTGEAYADSRSFKKPLPAVSGEAFAPVLVTLLKDPDAAIRRQATYTIREVGSAPAEVIEALAATLRNDADKTVRHGAVLALRDLGPASRAALPAIREALKDRYELVRRFARDALEKLGEK